MNDNKSYSEIIARNDVYTTDSSLYKKKNFPSLSFFYKYVQIIIKNSKTGKKGLYDRYEWVNSSIKILRQLEKVGVQFEITGMNNITETNGPAVFVANHMGTIETMVLPAIIQAVKPVVYVIKKELTTYPVFRYVINSRYPIVVERKNPRQDLITVLKKSKETIQNGKSIIIFAQKTRSNFFNKSEFNSLGVKIAKSNNVPVIPLALVTDAWANGKFIKEFGKIDPNKRVYLAFGKALTVTGNGSEQYGQVVKFIEDKFKEWGKLDHIIE